MIFPIKNHVEQLLNAYALRNVSFTGDAKYLEESIQNFIHDIDKINEKLKLLDIKADGAKQAVDIIIEEAKK